MSNLADIITRLEKATGPSEILDADIGVAIGRYAQRHGDRWVSEGEHHAVVLAPRYTSSIDAALTLVPKGFWLKIKTGTQAAAPDWQWPVMEIGSQSTGNSVWQGQAVTLPLTLCMAAFRARMEQKHG